MNRSANNGAKISTRIIGTEAKKDEKRALDIAPNSANYPIKKSHSFLEEWDFCFLLDRGG
jgi:hypothetical protein